MMADWQRRFYSLQSMWQMSANRWQLAIFLATLPTRLRLGGERLASFYVGPLRYQIRHQDWLAFREIILHREYDFVAGLLAQAEQPAVMDLGANVGLFSLLVLAMRPETAVYAVEPMPDTYQLLQRNQRANPQATWQTYQQAIWEQDGQVALQNETRSSASAHVSAAGKLLVPAARLDTFWQQHVKRPVTLLKVDIEGAEEVALRGQQAILAQAENLIVELHPHRCDVQAVLSLLFECYLHVYRVTGRLSAKPLLLATQKAVAGAWFVEIFPDEFEQQRKFEPDL